MAYTEGSVVGHLALLDLIKAEALQEGWEVKEDTTIAFDTIPASLTGCSSSVPIDSIRNWFDGSILTSASATDFFLYLPLALKPTAYSLQGVGSFTFSIFGIDESGNSTPLLTNASSSTLHAPILNAPAFRQYRFTLSNNTTIKAFNLKFETQAIHSRFLALRSEGLSQEENIHANFEALYMRDGARNIRVGCSAGYSNTGGFSAQPIQGSAVLYAHDGEIRYWLSVTKNRLLGVFKIHDPTDPFEKNPVYQFMHCGHINTYGAPSQLPSPYAVVGGGLDPSARWSSVNTTLPEKPLLYTPYPRFVIAESNTEGWSEANMPIDPTPEGNLFAMPVTLFSTGTMGDEPVLFGEYDGLVKVLASAASKSEDILTIEGESYRLFQNGKKTSLVDFFAMRRR